METARQTPPGARPNRNDVGAKAPGPSGPVVRVGCLMRRVTGVPEEWPSRLRYEPQALQNPAYRPADMFKGRPAENPPGAPPFLHDRGSLIQIARLPTRKEVPMKKLLCAVAIAA